MLPNKFGFKLNPYLCALLPLAMHGVAFAQALPPILPTGGQVVSGSAVITSSTDFNGTPIAPFVHVVQGSNNVLINWSTFDIGSGNIVQFDQPGTSSVAVNRVLSPNASFLDGALNSNGRVFIINPNGVLFGASSQVNVGGLLATTFDISDGDFNAGRFVFTDNPAKQGPSAGVISNKGSIRVGVDGTADSDCCDIIPNETGNGGSDSPPGLPPLTDGGVVVTADADSGGGGFAILAGRTVENFRDVNVNEPTDLGSIEANNGQIVLASGSSLAVSFDNGLISYEVTPRNFEAVNGFTAIRNSGELVANGGAITLLARASGTTPGVGILNSGTVRANGISVDGSGGVYLTSTGGSIESTGTIDVSAFNDFDEGDELPSPPGYTPQAVRIESDSSVVIGGVVIANGPLVNADDGGVPSAGTILIQGADVTFNEASISGASQVRVVATSGGVSDELGSGIRGSAIGIGAAGNIELAGFYESFINSEVPAVPGLEDALDPGSISIQGATAALDGATVDAASLVRIAATMGDVTTTSTEVSGDALDFQAAGNVELAGTLLAGPVRLGDDVLAAVSKEGTIEPGSISIQGASVDLNGVEISATGPVRIAAIAGDVNALSSSNDVYGSALDIRATGSVNLSGSYRTEQPFDPEIGVEAIEDGALSPGTISIQGAAVLLDGASIDAENQVRIRATTGDINIMGLPNDEFIDVYGSALDFQAAGSVKLSGDYLAGFDPVASVAFVDEASETGDIFIQGSEVVFNNASVTGSGEVRIIATSGDVSDIPVGGSTSTSNQITGNALGIKAAGSILLAGASLTVGNGETSIGGDPTVGNRLGLIEQLRALYSPEEGPSLTARADGFAINEVPDSPVPDSSFFVPDNERPNASFVTGEEGVVRIGSLQLSGDYVYFQSNHPDLSFSFNPGPSLQSASSPFLMQLVPAASGGSVGFEQNLSQSQDLNLSPDLFAPFSGVNATLVFGSTANPGNVVVGQEGAVDSGTNGFNYVLAAAPGGLIFNSERLITDGEVVVLGQRAGGGSVPPVDPPPGSGVLYPSPLPPGQTAEFVAARSEPVPAGARDITFDLAAALDSSIQYNSAVGPVLSCQ